MDIKWAALLGQYGQQVSLHRGEETVSVQAFLQPVRDQGTPQRLPSPLGLRREDRFLYLGPPQPALEGGTGDWVEWAGRGYEVVSAHPVFVGETVSHLWALLRPRDEEVAL